MAKRVYGTSSDGVPVDEYTMNNAGGMEVKIITYGGIVTSILVPDRDGNMRNVALGFSNLRDYETKSPYFGSIVGRYANRLANGKFSLDGVEYAIPVNNGPNSLHGGIRGFDKRVWKATETTDEDGSRLAMYYRSAHGEDAVGRPYEALAGAVLGHERRVA